MLALFKLAETDMLRALKRWLHAIKAGAAMRALSSGGKRSDVSGPQTQRPPQLEEGDTPCLRLGATSIDPDVAQRDDAAQDGGFAANTGEQAVW